MTEKINDFIWLGPKREDDTREETRLVDCDLEQLQGFYKHCHEMLYNEDPRNPGRFPLVKITEDQIQRCRAELLVRWLRSEKRYTYQNCYEDIRALIQNNRETLTQEVVETYPFGNIMDDIPNEYKRVPISLVLKASMYALGEFDVSHITLNFLIKQGIYLTQREMQVDLFERDPETGKAKDRMLLILQKEGLNPNIRLFKKETGLSYAEFHQMCRLRKDKYENFTTSQLRILSEKVLYRFQLRCEEQAKQWQQKAEEIRLVAESKGWDINAEIA